MGDCHTRDVGLLFRMPGKPIAPPVGAIFTIYIIIYIPQTGGAGIGGYETGGFANISVGGKLFLQKFLKFQKTFRKHFAIRDICDILLWQKNR